MNPSVVVTPPEGWVAASIEAPKLAEGSHASFTEFRSWHSPDGLDVLAEGCVATPIPGWVEDMRDAVTSRTVGLVLTTANQISSEPLTVDLGVRPFRILALDDKNGANEAAGRANHADRGRAQTFLGFSGSSEASPRVFTCFSMCVRPTGAEGEAASACATRVAESRLEGSGEPPPPGIFLGTASWAVRHPADVFYGAVGAVALASVWAVAGRRKPRARI